MNDLSPGFSSSLDSQACFRTLLEAYSTPGRIIGLPVPLTPPMGLSPACAALLLTLADAQTKISLGDEHPAQDWLVFHTGALLATQEGADFTIATTRPALRLLPQGTDEAPEGGATLILDLPSLDEGQRFRLEGPGLRAPVEQTLPLDAGFVAEWQAQRFTAPRGVDLLLCAGTRMLALPRSLKIEEV